MQNEPTEPIWTMYMQTLTQRKKQMEIGETIRKTISDWYFENGMPEPLWETKDPAWWTDYLKSLDENQ
jgi:hypothetical protein